MNMQDLLDKAKDTLDNAKNTLGLEPQETEAGIYIPSTSSLKIAAPNKTNYDHTNYDNPYTGDKKIMMVCTEEQYMTMENGNKFDTGNHPVEMMVPLLHFKKAGFDPKALINAADTNKSGGLDDAELTKLVDTMNALIEGNEHMARHMKKVDKTLIKGLNVRLE